jgi:hypothetical protein
MSTDIEIANRFIDSNGNGSSNDNNGDDGKSINNEGGEDERITTDDTDNR